MTPDDSDIAWEGEGVIAYIDIDDFKEINDEYGHKFGDEVIEKVKQLGNDNIPNEGTFTREYGQGDEFVVILPGFDIREAEKKNIENFQEAVYNNEPNGIEVKISAGIAETTSEELGLEEVKNWAEEAMRRAKEWGGDQIQVYGEFEPLINVEIRFDISAPPGRPDDRIIFETWRDGAEVDIRAEVIRNETIGAVYESNSSSAIMADERYEGELRAVVSKIETVDRRGVKFTVKVREADYDEIFSD